MSRQGKLRSLGVVHARAGLVRSAGNGLADPWRSTHSRDAGCISANGARFVVATHTAPGVVARSLGSPPVPTTIVRATVSVSGSILDAVPSTVYAATLRDVNGDPATASR